MESQLPDLLRANINSQSELISVLRSGPISSIASNSVSNSCKPVTNYLYIVTNPIRIENNYESQKEVTSLKQSLSKNRSKSISVVESSRLPLIWKDREAVEEAMEKHFVLKDRRHLDLRKVRAIMDD